MNVTQEQGVLLYILSLNPGHSMTVTELVDVLNEDRTEVIRQYFRLEDRGLVEKLPTDCGLTEKFKLTDEGERVLSSLYMTEERIIGRFEVY